MPGSTGFNRRRLLRQTAIASAAVLLVGTAAVATAQNRSVDEVMAAFIYQFTRYVDWPERAFETAESPLVICVVGNDALSENLERLTDDKDYRGRPIEIVRRTVEESPYPCHMLFIAAGVAAQLPGEGAKTLTIGDSESFTQRGGVIRLFQSSNKVRIEINIDAAKRTDIKISSKLLSLAKIVHDD